MATKIDIFICSEMENRAVYNKMSRKELVIQILRDCVNNLENGDMEFKDYGNSIQLIHPVFGAEDG